MLSQLTRHTWREERICRALARQARGLWGRTRLAAAARAGDLGRCALLLECGALVNARDGFGRTALAEAVSGGHGACAAYLVSRGAVGDAAFGGACVGTWGLEAAAGAGGGAHRVESLASVGGGRIAVGHQSGALHIRNTATGAVTATLVGHAHHVLALVALPGGRVASGGIDLSVRV